MTNNESLKPPEEGGELVQTAKNHVKSFLENTSAHGFGRIAVSSGIFRSIFWITLCISAHALFWFHTYKIALEYSKRPIRTKISIENAKKLDFPVVTICNRNILRKSKITKEMAASINKIFNQTAKSKKVSLNSTKQKHDALPDPDNVHSSHSSTNALRAILSSIEIEKLTYMGHQLDDMVVDCSFNGQDCSHFEDQTVWRGVWIGDIGNCYRFNHAMDGEGKAVPPYKTVLSGDLHGLILTLNIEQYEYLDAVTPYAGLKVILGQQKQMPFPLREGINVGPGLSTNIEVTRNHASRLDPFNNGTCEKTGMLLPSSPFRKYFNMSYSKTACTVSCLINMQNDECKCSQFPTGDMQKLCDFSNKTAVTCLNDVYEDYLQGPCDKVCPVSCSEMFFTSTISSSKWPAINYRQRLIRSLKEDYDLTMSSDMISENLLELRVYYSNLDYVRIEESLKYEFEDLISNIGGQMGMWIGLSAVTIFEVIELFWILIQCFLLSKKKNNKVVQINNYTR